VARAGAARQEWPLKNMPLPPATAHRGGAHPKETDRPTIHGTSSRGQPLAAPKGAVFPHSFAQLFAV